MSKYAAKVYDGETDSLICRLTEEEFSLLEDHLEEDFIEELEYELTRSEVKRVLHHGVSEDFQEKLEAMLGENSRSFIYWKTSRGK